MADYILYKRPNEKITYSYDFTPKLPSDSSLSASSVTAVDEAGVVATSEVVASSSASGLVLTGILQAGTDGKDYTITMQAVGTTSFDKREWIVEMRVRSKVGGST
jgi:hypothetical protein